jgi:hypothetical protein
VAIDRWGNPLYQTLSLQPAHRDGNFVGDLDGAPLRGRTSANSIEFTAKNGDATYVFTGKLEGERIAGTAQFPDTNDVLKSSGRNSWRRGPASVREGSFLAVKACLICFPAAEAVGVDRVRFFRARSAKLDRRRTKRNDRTRRGA